MVYSSITVSGKTTLKSWPTPDRGSDLAIPSGMSALVPCLLAAHLPASEEGQQLRPCPGSGPARGPGPACFQSRAEAKTPSRVSFLGQKADSELCEAEGREL